MCVCACRVDVHGDIMRACFTWTFCSLIVLLLLSPFKLIFDLKKHFSSHMCAVAACPSSIGSVAHLRIILCFFGIDSQIDFENGTNSSVPCRNWIFVRFRIQLPLHRSKWNTCRWYFTINLFATAKIFHYQIRSLSMHFSVGAFFRNAPFQFRIVKKERKKCFCFVKVFDGSHQTKAWFYHNLPSFFLLLNNIHWRNYVTSSH